MPIWLLGNLILGGVSLVTGIIGAIQTNQMNEENKRQRELDRKAAQEQIDKQNEYNSPKNQKARYKEAGMNMPGSVTPGNQTTVVSVPSVASQPLSFEFINKAVAQMTEGMREGMADSNLTPEQAEMQELQDSWDSEMDTAKRNFLDNKILLQNKTLDTYKALEALDKKSQTKDGLSWDDVFNFGKEVLKNKVLKHAE